MKSERRHELQKNEFADWVQEQWVAIEPYWQLIAGGAILAIVLVWGISYLATPAPKYAAEWRELFKEMASRDPGQADLLLTFADNSAGKPPGMWARLYAADSFLAEGTRQLFFDRKKSKENLDKAIAAYTAALREAKDDFVRTRATYALAQAYEASNQLDKAREQYKAVVGLAPDQAIGKEAAKRLAWLANPNNQAFLAWFAAATPNPFPAQTLPPSGLPPAPQPYDDLPSDPTLSLPTLDELTKPIAVPPPAGVTPMGTVPPVEVVPPAVTPAPADPAPTDPAPADPAKPTPPSPETPAPTDPAKPAPETPAPADPAKPAPAPETPAPAPQP